MSEDGERVVRSDIYVDQILRKFHMQQALPSFGLLK